MPSYTQHKLFNYLVFIAVLSALVYYRWELMRSHFVLMLFFSIGYYIGTAYITPDLDTDSSAYKRWGLLRVLWYPYKVLFKHRQSSHSILLGAVVRIIYITIIILILYYLLSGTLPSFGHGIDMAAFLLGIVIANVLHVALDKVA